MARQITGGLLFPSANFVSAHNENHRSTVALEFGGGAKPHYDGPEFEPVAGVEQVISATLGVPADLASAITVVILGKALFNDHLTRHNAGSGKKIYAHKVVDNANTVSTADTTAGATETATLLASLITLTTNLRIAYEHHRQNQKPDGTAAAMAYHQNADTANVLGGLPALSTADQVADALNLLKAEYEAHRVSLVAGGGAHDNADATNTITAANCTSADFDSMVTLCNQLRTKFLAHLTQATVHHNNDADNNATVTAAVSYPADLFTLANALKAAVNTHMGSNVYHETADAGVVTAADATTVASLITLAADIRVKLDAHLRNGPVSQAMRGV